MAISQISNAGIASAAGISTSKLGTGAVLQVVQYSNSTNSTNSSSTYATTNLTGSITPSSSSNKILVRALVQLYWGSSNSLNAGLRINRGGTIVSTIAVSNNVAAITMVGIPIVLEFLDSPATTSSTTYTIEYNTLVANSPYVYPTINTTFSGQANTSFLTLQEIAG